MNVIEKQLDNNELNELLTTYQRAGNAVESWVEALMLSAEPGLVELAASKIAEEDWAGRAWDRICMLNTICNALGIELCRLDSFARVLGGYEAAWDIVESLSANPKELEKFRDFVAHSELLVDEMADAVAERDSVSAEKLRGLRTNWTVYGRRASMDEEERVTQEE